MAPELPPPRFLPRAHRGSGSSGGVRGRPSRGRAEGRRSKVSGVGAAGPAAPGRLLLLRRFCCSPAPYAVPPPPAPPLLHPAMALVAQALRSSSPRLQNISWLSITLSSSLPPPSAFFFFFPVVLHLERLIGWRSSECRSTITSCSCNAALLPSLVEGLSRVPPAPSLQERFRSLCGFGGDLCF